MAAPEAPPILLAQPMFDVFTSTTRADPPGTIALVAAAATVGEAAGSVTLIARRSGGSAGSISATYATAASTATGGADFTSALGSVSWADGDVADKSITISILNDTADEPNETFTVTLTGTSVANPATATVTITDDDDPPQSAGAVAFVVPTAVAAENVGTLSLTVRRSGGTAGAITVSFAATAGSAGNADFALQLGTLSWANGDAGDKTIAVQIVNDTADESNESFTVSLSAPTGGATLGAPAQATVTITDDDDPPAPSAGVVGFASAAASVAEAAGSIELLVERTGGSAGAVSVQYSTTAGTAGAGSDFSVASGTLTWAAGDTASKPIVVVISSDSIDEPNETLTVTLSSLTGGASLGIAAVTVTILDDDPAQAAVAPPATQPAAGGGGGGGGALDVWVLLALAAFAAVTRRQRRSRSQGRS
jgi:hypothetical protein